MAGRMILIEGLDLAGKSTLVRNLQAELGRRGITVRVSRNALCPDNPIAALADEVRRDGHAGLIESGALFLAAHLWDARHFTLPPDGVVHIQDSCWLRTVAYHMVTRTPFVASHILEASVRFPRFDAATFLTAGLAERQRRLITRERACPGANDHGDHAVVNQPEAFLRQDAILCRLAERVIGATVIETDEVSPNEICTKAIQTLRLS